MDRCHDIVYWPILEWKYERWFICFAIDPPSRLVITGYEEGTTIDAGTVLRLMCTATSGNPLATLSWYKNDKKVSGLFRREIEIF